MAPATTLPAYTRMRVARRGGTVEEIRLPRPLSPAQATELARAARAEGLRVSVLTDPVACAPGRAPVRVPEPAGPTRPMPRWQQQRVALFTDDAPHPTATRADDVARVRAAIGRLLRAYGADAIRNALREEVSH